MKQLHNSEELKPLMALYLQDTVQKGKLASYARLKDVFRRFLEQNTRNNNSNARNEDQSLQGAAPRTESLRGNPECNGQEASRDRQIGDCAQ